ncbi:MAG: TrbI F-type domain-containing protein [Pacificimonas sp.]
MPLKVGTLLTMAISVAALLWAGWATITLMDVRDRRIVTVGLADLMADFIEVESRSVGDPETTKMRTVEYLAAVDRAVAELADDGTTVLVAEAVISDTAPDYTGRVRARIAADLEGETR